MRPGKKGLNICRAKLHDIGRGTVRNQRTVKTQITIKTKKQKSKKAGSPARGGPAFSG
jgi:hypothetical protein